MDPVKIEDAPLSELLRDALGDARELVKLEVELATDEVKKHAAEALRAAVAFGVAVAAAVVALALFAVALVLALGGTAAIAAAVGGGFVVVAGAAAAFGYSALPKRPMEATRSRVRSDMEMIKENLA
ncbi:MAG: phage holin family protein [Deltaproteobacteria bacterium]|nr:phage holin family protein [Myxococcales bacterium]MDP3217754.1 phage holin family protein [Deltaproteobacteria bacterium]